ncbi:MAG: glycosyltransferase family 4 protein [Dysgonomonas sp.]
MKKLYPEGDNKIVLVSHEMSRTGAPMLLLYVAKALYYRGWSVVVISKKSGPLVRMFSQFSDVIISNETPEFQSRLNFLKDNGFNKVIINSIISGGWCKLFKNNDFKVITLVHELPDVIKSWKAEKKLFNATEYSDLLVFPAKIVMEKFNTFRHHPFNYEILPQGIFLKGKSKVEKYDSKCYISQKYNLDSKPMILNVATGNYRKGVDVFQSAAKLIPNCNFIWVGDVDKSLIKDISDNVYFFGYIKDSEELSKFYQSASLFFISSREEPFGSVVLESMYNGTPVVGFKNVGGFQDVIVEGETGYLVDFCDLENFKFIVEKLLSDEVKLESMSIFCREKVKEYDFDDYVTSLTKTFDIQNDK